MERPPGVFPAATMLRGSQIWMPRGRSQGEEGAEAPLHAPLGASGSSSPSQKGKLRHGAPQGGVGGVPSCPARSRAASPRQGMGTGAGTERWEEAPKMQDAVGTGQSDPKNQPKARGLSWAMGPGCLKGCRTCQGPPPNSEIKHNPPANQLASSIQRPPNFAAAPQTAPRAPPCLSFPPRETGERRSLAPGGGCGRLCAAPSLSGSTKRGAGGTDGPFQRGAGSFLRLPRRGSAFRRNPP